MVKNQVYEETKQPIQNTYINGKAYIPFKFMNNIYEIDDIISHHGELYIRPLSLKELVKYGDFTYCFKEQKRNNAILSLKGHTYKKD